MRHFSKLMFKLTSLACIAGLFALGLTTSCVSPKSIVYFQGDTTTNYSQEIKQQYVPVIQPNDLLSVVVGSLSAEANEVFNMPNMFTTTSTNFSHWATLSTTTVLLNSL
jgi:polysaccharide export outer membrane protein